MIYFSDVDVVTKLAVCGFLPLLPELLDVPEDELEVRYLESLKHRFKRKSKQIPKPDCQEDLIRFCGQHKVAHGLGEVTRQEQLIQAGLDSGEALLFSESEATKGIVVTGDKRAIQAYVKASSGYSGSISRVICWEQLLLRVNKLRGFETFKTGCCQGMDFDGLLRIAFTNGQATLEDHAIAAVVSYLRGLQKVAGNILVEMDL